MKKQIFLIFFSVIILSLMLVRFQQNQEKDIYTSQPMPELPKPPLKELAERRGLDIGSFASLKYLRERPYSEILASEFEYAIIDGEPNWKFEDFTLRPTEDEFNFSHMDQVFDFADQNDMPVRVQHLLWGDEKWLPEWLKEGNYSNEDLMDIVKNHIDKVVSRYRGKVREYTVVNEAFSRKLETGGNKDWWGERLDTEYIDNAFIWTKNADPNAVLILNDFGNETQGDISNLMFDYIRDAKLRGIPIDALGMQMHISGVNAPTKEEVVKNMLRFSDLGLKIYITEFDVNMHDVEGTEEAKLQKQAEIYAQMLGACIEVGSDICPNFGYLGLVDRQSWYNGIGITDADPLMLNDDYVPKPAFHAIRNTLTD